MQETGQPPSNSLHARLADARFRQVLQDLELIAVQGFRPDGTITFWNRGSELLYGFTTAEAMGQDIVALLQPPDMQAREREILATAVAQHQAQVADELEVVRKDGSKVHIFASRVLIQPENGPPEFFCFDVDLSARRSAEAERSKLQQELAQTQKMESIGRLAGGIAHDFNNMLGVILGAAEMALAAMSPEHPAYSSLQDIHTAATRSAGLTQQLLGFARKQAVSPRVVDVNRAVADTLQILQRLLGEQINLQWLPGKQLAPVRMDPTQLHQILTNLCINARDSIVRGRLASAGDAVSGNLKIQTCMQLVDAEFCRRFPECAPGSYLCLRVTDDGEGMDQATLMQIFEPFFSTKSLGKGTGLGLATVFGIVKQNGGYIFAESEPGRGASFQVLLPPAVTTPDVEAVMTPAPAPRAASKRRLLVVEDEPMVLAVTTKMLESSGYEVLAAASPRQALTLLSDTNQNVDLLLTDMIMPEMNGHELTLQLRARWPNLPVIFISGYTDQVVGDRARQVQASYFLQKPFTLSGLTAMVQAALQ